jgi:hypothetical protein
VRLGTLSPTLCSLVASFLFLYSSVFGQFYVLETENLRQIYYGKAQEYLVPYVARSFENAVSFHSKLFDYNPTEKVTVFLHDLSDYGNAGASTIPMNKLAVAIAPTTNVYETTPSNERMNSTMNHELVHLVTSDKASRTDRFYRSLFFGKVVESSEHPLTMLYSYLTTPRRSTPRWWREGIAVFLETWMAGGLGRALGGYDEMVFRTIVYDGGKIYDLLGIESEGTKISFQAGVSAYLYGTRFMSYLAFMYGPETLIQWTARTDDSHAYFASQFQKIYGMSLQEGWSAWIDWETNFQRENIRIIQSAPTTPFRTISRRPLGSVSRAFYDSVDNKLYLAVNFPGQVAHVGALDVSTGNIQRITDIKGPALYYATSLVYDPETKDIFFTTDNDEWRDLNVVNVKTGAQRSLMKDARIGDLAFNPVDKSIWGVRHDNGISTLVRIPHPYEEWNTIYVWPYGSDISDIDVSPDGKHVTAGLAEINGRQTLIRMDINKLMNEEKSHETLFDFENSIPANFVHSGDGAFLYGSSYYNGVSNIYRYEFAKSEMNIMTNCETGFFRPLPVSGDSLIVFRYTEHGFVPAMIPNKPVDSVRAIRFLGNEIASKHPIVQSWIAQAPSSVNIDSLTIYKGEYTEFSDMRLVSAYPIVEGYKDFAAYGMAFNFSTPIALHTFEVKASYTPNRILPSSERLHAGMSYGFPEWKIHAKYNGADFYDLFGPTKTSRKGYALGVQHKKNLLFDEPKSMDYTVYVTGYGGLETLPEAQNISASFSRIVAGGARLSYKDLRASLGAVDHERGYKWDITGRINYVPDFSGSNVFPLANANFDFGIPLPIDYSALWLRNSVGYSFGDTANSFSYFYFGGYGNNWIDNLPEKRYREYYSFPGVALNELSGISFVKVMVDWTLPPINFRQAGIQSFYSNWMRIGFFTTGLMTDVHDKAYRATYGNVGTQVDFRIIMLSHLNLTFSLGYAVAAEKNQPKSDEFMISLKIM